MDKTAERTIKSSFLLDPPKLGRIVNLIANRFNEKSSSSIVKLKLVQKSGKTIEVRAVKDVLGHDNPVENPIETLSILASDGCDEPTHKCDIIFNRRSQKTSISVVSDDSSLVNEFFDELEEQVRRSLIKDKLASIKEVLIPISVFAFILTLFFGVMYYVITSDYAMTEKLSDSDVKSLHSLYESAVTEADKVDAIFEFHRKIIDNNADSKSLWGYIKSVPTYLSTGGTYLILVPLVVVIVLIKKLLDTFVGSVFFWGDYKEYYEKKLEKRKDLQRLLLGSVFLGILMNLFSIGIAG